MAQAIKSFPFLSGGGEAADLIARFDWLHTSLGPIESWPASITSVLSLILRSPIPIVTLWGEDGIMIYNDAYSVFAGARHPDLLGSKVRDGWDEVSDFNDNVMKVGLSGGTLAYRDQELTLHRNGRPEQVWMNLDYSPITDERGRPIGVMAIVAETTPRVRAERELISERESLRKLFEQAPGFIGTVAGPQHRFTMANAAYRELVGNRDMVGKTVEEALPEVASQGFVKLLNEVYRTGEPYIGQGLRVELMNRDEQQEDRYVDFVYQPILGEDGKTRGIFIQGHDVTDRKQQEIAIRESEIRFRLVAENAPVMLWMGDAQGKCIYLNKALRDFWGVAEDGIDSFDWMETVQVEDESQLAEFGRGMAEQKPFSVETNMRRADGEYRIISTNAQPRFGERGQFLGMIGVNVDVTEARNVESAIRKESHKLEILNRTGAAVAEELDIEKIVQMVTDACTELVGAQFGAFFYNVTDEKGESYMLYALSGVSREAFSKFPMPRNTAVFAPTFNGEGVVRSDDILLDPRYGKSAPYHGMPQGHLPVRSYLAVPVSTRSGEIIGGLFFGHAQPGKFHEDHEDLLMGIAGQAATAIDNARLLQAAERELKERRAAEAALQLLNTTLEQRVISEVRERSKAEEQLRQIQKMEAVGQLTGGIAHDFNNMLAVILGGLSLLQRKLAKGQTDVNHLVEGAIDGAQRAAALTQRLLAFSRQQPLKPEPLDATKLVSGMIELLKRTLGEAYVIDTRQASDIWMIKVDPGQLENAILNLSVNARDAMPGGGTLTIETSNVFIDDSFAKEHALDAGEYVLISVTDTGVGMTNETIARAFEPFFTTKGVGKGTGLGLSQVYGFVRQSGGHVSIHSQRDQGTTIRLYLPRLHGANTETRRKIDHTPAERAKPGEIIMVVEDEERVRAVSVEALKDLGYDVIEASNAQDALRLLNSDQKVTLLFTDIVMPEMSGWDLANWAREKRPGLQLLYTTGYTRNAIGEENIRNPNINTLMKPFTISELAAKIRSILDGKRV